MIAGILQSDSGTEFIISSSFVNVTFEDPIFVHFPTALFPSPCLFPSLAPSGGHGRKDKAKKKKKSNLTALSGELAQSSYLRGSQSLPIATSSLCKEEFGEVGFIKHIFDILWFC